MNEKPSVKIELKEPTAIAGEHYDKGEKANVTPTEARYIVGQNKGKYASDADAATAAGGNAEDGAGVRVNATTNEVEHVSENYAQRVVITKTEPVDQYAKRQRETGGEDAKKEAEKATAERTAAERAEREKTSSSKK